MRSISDLIGLLVRDDLRLRVGPIEFAGAVPYPNPGVALDAAVLRGLRAGRDGKITGAAVGHVGRQVDHRGAVYAGCSIAAGHGSFGKLMRYRVPRLQRDGDVDGRLHWIVVVVASGHLHTYGLAGLEDVASWLDSDAGRTIGGEHG